MRVFLPLIAVAFLFGNPFNRLQDLLESGNHTAPAYTPCEHVYRIHYVTGWGPYKCLVVKVPLR